MKYALIVQEDNEGKVKGSFMKIDHDDPYEIPHIIGNSAYEHEDVEQLITYLHALKKDDRCASLSMTKEVSLEGETLLGACLHCIEIYFRFSVYIYRDYQWFEGTHLDTPEEGLREKDLELRTMTTFYGVPSSSEHRKTLRGIEDTERTLHGDSVLLQSAIDGALDIDIDWKKNYEDHPSVSNICNWWNSVVDQELACAGVFKIWVWNDARGIFISGDNEEPVTVAEAFIDRSDVAFFSYKGTKIAVEFQKGKEHNRYVNNWSVTYSVTGEIAESWGLNEDELNTLDISRITIKGLQRILELLPSQEQ